MELFRREVSEARSHRLMGEVIITRSRAGDLVGFALVIGVAMILTWLLLGSFARTETSRGVLVTDTPSAEIMTPLAGVMRDLRVREGELVRKGQIVGIVGLDRRSAEGSAIASGGMRAVDERLTLAEQRKNIVGTQEANERTRLTNVSATLMAKIRLLQEQISNQEGIVASNKAMFEQVRAIMEKGYLSKTEYERRRQQWLASRSTLDALRLELANAEGELSSTAIALKVLPDSTAGSINELESSIRALGQQRLELTGSESYALVAPIAGRVTILQAGPGRSVRANVPLLVIVPDRASLQAEVYVPSRAVGFVKPGQEVRLLYDAFPYQRFGSFGGTVASVSRAPLNPNDAPPAIKLDDAAYRVVVRIPYQHVNGYGQVLDLQPGMTLTANLILERQSFFAWLLNPLRAVVNRQ